MTTALISKNSQRKLRKAVQWEEKVARCANCKHYQPAITLTVDGHKQYATPFCQENQFNTNGFSLCNLWSHIRTGETLDVDVPAKKEQKIIIVARRVKEAK